MRRALTAMLCGIGCVSPAGDRFELQPEGTDLPELEDPSSTSWRPTCVGSMALDGRGIDPCPWADLVLLGREPAVVATDLSLAVGESRGCRVYLDLDDVCEPGRYWVTAGVSSSGALADCGGEAAVASSGWVDVRELAVAVVEGQHRVSLEAGWSLELGSQRLEGEVAFAVATAGPGAAGFERCANVPVEVSVDATSRGPLDVLFVVDSSEGMGELQQAVGDAYASLVRSIEEVSADWHLAVITMDMESPLDKGRMREHEGQRVVHPGLSDPSALFGALVRAGSSGSPYEFGRRAVQEALTEPLLSGLNAGFYRPEARLAVVAVSRADDHSDVFPTTEQFLGFLSGLKQRPEQLSWSSLVALDPSCGEVGQEFVGLTTALGGDTLSACAGDPGQALVHLPSTAGPARHALDPAPVPETLVVELVQSGRVTPLQRGLHWTFVPPELTLTTSLLPTEGAVRIRYVPTR